VQASTCVLLIDDDETIRELVSEVLGDEGYGVVAVADAEAGLEAARRSPPRVVLLDTQASAATADPFVTAYRQGPGPHAPIYLFSATTDAAEVAQRIGLDGVFAKPFDIESLVDLATRHGCGATPRSTERPADKLPR
jgi:CheY-like chemotaxis protein